MTLGLLFNKIKHNNDFHIGLLWDLREYLSSSQHSGLQVEDIK